MLVSLLALRQMFVTDKSQAMVDLPTDILAPNELWYTFANSWKEAGKVYYSGGFTSAKDAYADHLKRGKGKLAIDIGTGGETRVLRAPDLHGEAVVWDVSFGDMGDEEVGKYIKLQHGQYSWIIGHVFATKGDSKAQTGEAIGFSGGCIGMKVLGNQGVTNGCHAHLEFFQRDVSTTYSSYPMYTDVNKIIPIAEASELEAALQELPEDQRAYDTYEGGSYLGKWDITTYYAPVEGQTKYFMGSYAADKAMNCGPGDCLVTASGYHLKAEDQYKIVACPKGMPFGTRLRVEGIPNEVRCEDRGGAIKGKHLDLWVGQGDSAWIGKYSSNAADVWQL